MRSKSSFLLREIIKINSVFYLLRHGKEEEKMMRMERKDVAHTIKGATKNIYPGAKKNTPKTVEIERRGAEEMKRKGLIKIEK